MERALLQGERESEAARLRQEQEAVQQLQEKLSSLDASIRKERDKVSPGAGILHRGLCHAHPSACSWCRSAPSCGVLLGTHSPVPELCRGIEEHPLWFHVGGEVGLSVCLPGTGPTALPEEGRADALGCVLAAVRCAGGVLRRGSVLQGFPRRLLPAAGSTDPRVGASALPALAGELSCGKSPRVCCLSGCLHA